MLLFCAHLFVCNTVDVTSIEYSKPQMYLRHKYGLCNIFLLLLMWEKIRTKSYYLM